MTKQIKKVGGKLHKSAVGNLDPLGLVPEKYTDPLALFPTEVQGQAEPGAATSVMPDADSQAVAAARRRKAAAMKMRGGRASTILGGEDRLGS